MNLTKTHRVLPVAAIGLLFAAGCGASKTDVSKGTAAVNQALAPDTTFACPKQVQGGEGTQFECTMKGKQSGKTGTIQLKIVKENGDLAVDVVDKNAFNLVHEKVTSGG